MGARDPTRYQELEDKKEEKMDDKRISRRDFIRGAALTGAGLAAASCAPATEAIPEKDKIVVGMSRPLSGPLAVIGTRHSNRSMMHGLQRLMPMVESTWRNMARNCPSSC